MDDDLRRTTRWFHAVGAVPSIPVGQPTHCGDGNAPPMVVRLDERHSTARRSGPKGKPGESTAKGRPKWRVVWAATLDTDGPTGGVFRDGKSLP